MRIPSHAGIRSALKAIVRGTSESAGPALVPSAATLARPEGRRRYLVASPIDARPGRRPLIIILHGAGASAEQVLGQAFPPSPLSLWLEIAAREQLVVMAPDAGKGGWTDCFASDACRAQKDDVGFIEALIEHAIASHHVDPDRICLIGVSRGGWMAYAAAVELPHRLAAFSVVLAGMPPPGRSKPPATPLAALIFGCTADPLIYYSGGKPWYTFGFAEPVRSIDDTVKVWRELGGLPDRPAIVQLPASGIGGRTSVTRCGGRYSMGGQTAVRMGLHLDMRRMNKLVTLDRINRVARVQAGMTWRDLQDALDPLDLAVQTMQSFANFTVGGTVSVNGHGRYVGNGPVGNSVRALQLVLADGSIKEVSRSANPELFRAAIGGYGAIGVITEVELDLALNCRIERAVTPVGLDAYPDYFRRSVRGKEDCVLHNADLLPPRFDAPVAVSWNKTDKPLTEPARLSRRGEVSPMNQNVIFAVTELPGGALLYREVVHPLLRAKPAVKWRNHEASLDVAELEPRTRALSTYALQEYFIPVRHFAQFAREMAAVIQKHDAEVLNVSIRHSDADAVALLPWAKEEVFSFVVYYKQRTYPGALGRIGDWTREMIDTALKFDGRYYLPYQLHATQAQFDKAYPEAAHLRTLKHVVDPSGKFSNELWRKYL